MAFHEQHLSEVEPIVGAPGFVPLFVGVFVGNVASSCCEGQ